MNEKEIAGINEVNLLVDKADRAQKKLAYYSQQEIDTIISAMAKAAWDNAEHLARLAAGETGMGRVDSKTEKNKFACKEVYEHILPMKTTGIIRFDEKQNCYEIAEPIGVIAAVIPTTNPTSTTIFKALINIKARNSIVFAPHPRAVNCINETVKILQNAASLAGAPDDCMSCMKQMSLKATQHLMKHKNIDLILATGGPSLVKAAYTSGKPAYGVGAGNTPAYIDRSASVKHAVSCIIQSQLFDFGTICSSEQSVIVDSPVKEQVIKEFKEQGAYFLSPQEVDRVSKIAVNNGTMSAQVVGQPAYRIAEMAGISVPAHTSVLIAPLEGVGADYPLSYETLAPLLAFYVVNGWEEGCKISHKLLSIGGMGHSQVVHATNPDVILEFGLQKPVSRIMVNAPTSQGGPGISTNLVPSLTLGCGAFGDNITSDNISTEHMFNIKRVTAIKEDFPLWEGRKKINKSLAKLELSDDGIGNISHHKPHISKKITHYNEAPIKSVTKENPWNIRNYPDPDGFHNKGVDWP